MKGKLIVLEGIDCSGKTTQCRALQKQLDNAVFLCFPKLDKTSNSGTKIKEILEKGEDTMELQQLFAENRREEKQRIQRLLDNGNIVIIDRYSYSGMAYGIVNKPHLGLQWFIDNEVGVHQPDLVIWLYIDPNISSQRPDFGKGANETLEVQTKVAQAYQMLCEIFGGWMVIDATLPKEVITQQILREILALQGGQGQEPDGNSSKS